MILFSPIVKSECILPVSFHTLIPLNHFTSLSLDFPYSFARLHCNPHTFATCTRTGLWIFTKTKQALLDTAFLAHLAHPFNEQVYYPPKTMFASKAAQSNFLIPGSHSYVPTVNNTGATSIVSSRALTLANFNLIRKFIHSNDPAFNEHLIPPSVNDILKLIHACFILKESNFTDTALNPRVADKGVDQQKKL